MLAPVVEDLAEDVVVDSRVAGVDPFDFRRVHNTSKLYSANFSVRSLVLQADASVCQGLAARTDASEGKPAPL